LAEAAETHKMVGLIMVDIDHFKRVNDSFGHRAGDESSPPPSILGVRPDVFQRALARRFRMAFIIRYRPLSPPPTERSTQRRIAVGTASWLRDRFLVLLANPINKVVATDFRNWPVASL